MSRRRPAQQVGKPGFYVRLRYGRRVAHGQLDGFGVSRDAGRRLRREPNGRDWNWEAQALREQQQRAAGSPPAGGGTSSPVATPRTSGSTAEGQPQSQPSGVDRGPPTDQAATAAGLVRRRPTGRPAST